MIPGAHPDPDPSVELNLTSGPNGDMPRPDAPTPRPVNVNELKRAWRSVAAGDFQHLSQRRGHPVPDGADGRGPGLGRERAAGERVVAVVGCVGSAGATTLALATALSSPGPTRVVECCSATTSGLTAAATAELGVDAHGWRQGRREHVLLQRANTPLLAVDHVRPPTPAAPDTLTILDVGWEATQLAGSRGWLSDAVANADVLVFVTPATTAGMRRMAGAINLLTDPTLLARSLGERLEGRLGGHGQPTTQVVLGVRGPSQRRWDRSLQHEAGPDAARLFAHGALVEIPHCRDVAVRGLDSRPVPSLLTSAARDVLHRLDPHEQRLGQRLEHIPEQIPMQRSELRAEQRLEPRPEHLTFGSVRQSQPSSRGR